MEHNSLDSSLGRVLVSAAVLYTLFKLPSHGRALIRELHFYSREDWDLWKDSGQECWMQGEFRKLLSHWPIGVLKVGAEAAYILVSILLMIVLINAAFGNAIAKFGG